MAEPTLDDTMPDVERLTRALRKFMNLKRIRVPYAVLRKLPDVLRASKFSVKCVVRVTPDDMFVYDIFDAKERRDHGWTRSRYWYNNRFCCHHQYGYG